MLSTERELSASNEAVDCVEDFLRNQITKYEDLSGDDLRQLCDILSRASEHVSKAIKKHMEKVNAT